jgi:hypothetical protein
MRQELARRYPVLADEVRATDPYRVVDLLRR